MHSKSVAPVQLESTRLVEEKEGRHRAYISLGSNLGDKHKQLQQARDEINKLPGVRIVALSKLYQTEPQDVKDQPWFCNQVAALSCARAVTPEGLLESLLYIEKLLGRKRLSGLEQRLGGAAECRAAEGQPKGPRCLDLDLLLFDQEVRVSSSDGADLTLPHPRMTQRAFVLIPLLEIAPDLRLPSESSLADALKALPYALEGEKITQP